MPSPARTKPVFTPRSLAKLLDGSVEAIWIIDSKHRIAWLNQPCGDWLGIDPTLLVGRVAAASSTSNDAFDQLAASLAAPVGLESAGLICTVCEPPNVNSRLARYLRVGDNESKFVIASTGQTIPLQLDAQSIELNQLRSRVHQWRKRDSAWGGIAAAGSSKSAKRLRAQIQLAHSTRQDISICGPPGCGGEAIARRIHGSGRTPLLAIDGPLMDAELLEASLSPAAAHLGGDSIVDEPRILTLLLRGLDETPLDVQQRLEQFITERSESVRLIGLLTTAIDEALTTNKLIAALAARLEVLSIRVDAIAARIEDVPMIASAIVDARHVNGGGPAERINRAALDRLSQYPWPMNFDELDAAMRHAMSNCTGPAIGPEHLPLAIRSYQPGEPVPQNQFIVQNLDSELERFELRMIKAAIESANGNRSEAARKLGISRARLLRRIGESEPGTP